MLRRDAMKILLRVLVFVLLGDIGVSPSALAADFKGITLGLVSTSWNTQLPPAVAQRAGFYKEEGLEVRSVTIASGGPIMMALLSSGQAEMVIAGAVAMLRGIASGAPAVVVGGIVDKPDYALVGAKGMKSLSDLKGKVIGSTGAGSFSEFAVMESLRRNGLLRDRDYTLIPVGGTAVRVAALETNKIQAAPLSSGERVRVVQKGFPMLLEIGKTLPEYPFTILVATKKFAASSPDKIVGVLRALGKAADLIRKDKDRAVELGRIHGLRGEPEIQRKALDYVADDFEVHLKRENIAALLNAIGVKGAPEQFFNQTFLSRSLGAH
jgi:ABC-type nitrate/sulfonate/bicarbonate transport system substrate-binding protein